MTALTSSISISKNLLDTIKPESFTFNQKYHLDTNQSRQSLNEGNLLIQAQSRIKQLENEVIELQLVKTQNMITAAAKPQVK